MIYTVDRLSRDIAHLTIRSGEIEREILHAECEKQIIFQPVADIDTRIGRQEPAAANLRSLYDYCRDVERELVRFEFDDQRLAREALA